MKAGLNRNARNVTAPAGAGSAVNEPALLTRKQLAKKLSLSPRSIDNLQRSRKIGCIKLSKRCVRFSLAAVLSQLQRFEIKAVQ